MAPLVGLPVTVGVRIRRWLKRLHGGWHSNVEVFPLHAPRVARRLPGKKRHAIRRSNRHIDVSRGINPNHKSRTDDVDPSRSMLLTSSLVPPNDTSLPE